MLDESVFRQARFNHFGLAVRDLASACTFYQALGYQCSDPIVDMSQEVEIVMCRSALLPDVELLKPLHDKSPVSRSLKTSDAVIYHICLEVDNLEEFLKSLKATHRVVCVKPRTPAVLFDQRPVSFYYVKGVGLFEFLESES
ncbi:MAG: VOC family protein [Desulfomonile tiedjei]|nr:VOC family protein [Desulfomonile tiedjei]